MSEELRQKGYLNGKAQGARVGEYEGFNLGATNLNQLRKAGILPKRNFAKGTAKPDGLVVDRGRDSPEVKLVIEYKDGRNSTNYGLWSDSLCVSLCQSIRQL